jgi:predicted nuclease of predicted toxin-antitoxin system
MTMAEGTSETLFIRLYLDEDVFKDVAPALRARGFDAISVHELDHYGRSDAEQLAYAAAEGRAIFTFNAPDYIALHRQYLAEGKSHAGIVVSKQRPIRETLRRLLNLLNRVSAGEMPNQLWWI